MERRQERKIDIKGWKLTLGINPILLAVGGIDIGIDNRINGDSMEKGVPLIVSDNNEFRLHNYTSEKELEDLAIKHSNEIFGDDVVYIDIKKKMTSKKGISGIPDGFMIDFGCNKCYIVEVELSTHNIVSHISNQLIRFKAAMNNNETREQLAKNFYDKLVHNRSRSNTKLSDIQRIVNRQFGIVILIDDVSEQLAEIVNILSQDGTEVIAIPFETYIDSKNNYIHKFTTFTKEALENESKKWTFRWTTVPIERHLDRTDKNMKEIFTAMRNQICSLPNVKEKSRKGWITYQTSPLKNFCLIRILPNSLEVHLKCDGSFTDENGVAKDIERTASWTFDKVFTIGSLDDIEYAMHLIKQAYSCVCKKR